MSSDSPSEWSRRTLGTLADYINGFGFSPDQWSANGLPIVRIENMRDPDAVANLYDGTLPDRFKVVPGDLLLSWSATLMALVWNRPPAWVNQHIFKVVPRSSVDRSYLHHLLAAALDQLAGQSHGTTMKHLKRSDFLPFEVRVAPAAEQRRIAEILDTVDQTIGATQRLIAKLEQVKQGLLQDLLTRGIDQNGQLRDPQRHPNRFKPSSLGSIPKEWRIATLGSIARRVTDGTHQAVTTLAQGDSRVPFLYVSCVREGQVLWHSAASIDRATYASISKGREPEPGMILYTAVGSYGHAAVVSVARDFGFQRHIACIYPVAAIVDSSFVAYWLNSGAVKQHADRVALGNAQRTVTLGELSRYPVPVPSLDEQRGITSLIQGMDERLAAGKASLDKARLLKAGLTDDLLTGRVRVALEAAGAA